MASSLSNLDLLGWFQLVGALIAIFLGGLRLYEFYRDRSRLQVKGSYGRFRLLKEEKNHRAIFEVKLDIANLGRRDTTIADVQLAYNVDRGGAYIVTQLNNRPFGFKSVRLQQNGREVLELHGEAFISSDEVMYLERPFVPCKLLVSAPEADLEYSMLFQQVRERK